MFDGKRIPGELESNIEDTIPEVIDIDETEQEPSEEAFDYESTELFQYFMSLCENGTQKEMLDDSDVQAEAPEEPNFNPRCEYMRGLDNDNLYYALVPLKVEEFSIEPRLTIFHDVISDSEIQELLNVVEGNVRDGV